MRTTGLPTLLLTTLIAAGILGCAETPVPAPVPEPTPPPVPVAPAAPPADPARASLRQVHLEIFADDRDPATAAFLKELDAALTKAFLPEQLRRRVLNPDDKTNYARLTAFEKASGTKQFAPVEAFLTVVQDYEGPDPHLTGTEPPPPLRVDAAGFIEPYGHPLALIGRAEIAARLQPAIRVLLHPNKGMVSVAQPERLQAAAERLLMKTAWSLKLPADFPGEIDPRANGMVKTWPVVWPPGDEPVPVVELALLYHPIDCPVCSDTEILVLTVGGKIHAIEALRPIERHGEAIPAEAAEFLAQFERQALDGGLSQRLAKVDGIAGASKTVANVKQLLGDLDRAVKTPTGK